MQTAIKRFLNQTRILDSVPPECVAQVVLDFWASVAVLLREAWDNPRRYLINKGVGVYALMGIAGDLCLESRGHARDKRFFSNKLAEFICDVDWRNSGTFKGLGGEAGVKAAVGILREARSRTRLTTVTRNG